MNRSVGLLLAGGKGTRMEDPRPKPLVTLRGEALIVANARKMIDAGISELYVALHHQAEEIQAGLIPHLPASVPVRWIVERKPLGTIGAIGRLRGLNCTVLTMNADLVSDLALDALLSTHAAREADVTIATHEESLRLSLGEVVCDDENRVEAYLEKPEKRFRIASGINALEPAAVALVANEEAIGFPDLVTRALAASLKVLAYPHTARWVDVNNRSALQDAEEIDPSGAPKGVTVDSRSDAPPSCE